jgi:hypothetical protein
VLLLCSFPDVEEAVVEAGERSQKEVVGAGRRLWVGGVEWFGGGCVNGGVERIGVGRRGRIRVEGVKRSTLRGGGEMVV